MLRVLRASLVPALMLALMVAGCSKEDNDPGVPTPHLAGDTSGCTGDTLRFSVWAGSAGGKELAYQMDWDGGDTMPPGWTSFYPAGETVRFTHVFPSPGQFHVRAKAMEQDSTESAWSDLLPVNVVDAAAYAPRNLTISALTDSTVLLSWEPPPGDSAHVYAAYFQATGSTGFVEYARTTNLMVGHTPQGHTGTYRVAAVYGSTPYAAAEKPTTVPVHSPPISVSELNAPANSGYGWSRIDGAGQTYSMTQAANSATVDFYVTNYDTGYAQLPYLIASPDMGPADPGGVVPTGQWRSNGFSNPLSNEHLPLPPDSALRYFNYTEVAYVPMLLACHTEDNHFALLKVTDVNSTNGTVMLESWFQPVTGLRLIEH